MRYFKGKKIKNELDLLKLKVEAIDFIKSMKFKKTDLDKLTDLIFELAAEFIFNESDAYMSLVSYSYNTKKELEVYVYNKHTSVEMAREFLDNKYNLMKGTYLYEDTKFVDVFELKPEEKSGIGIRIVKFLKP